MTPMTSIVTIADTLNALVFTKLISRIPWAIYVHYARIRVYPCVSGRVQDDYTRETWIVRYGSLLITVIVIAIGIPSMR